MWEVRVFRPSNTTALVVDFAPDPVGRAGEDQAVGVLGGTFGAEDGRVEAEDRGGCGWDGGLVGHGEMVRVEDVDGGDGRFIV